MNSSCVVSTYGEHFIDLNEEKVALHVDLEPNFVGMTASSHREETDDSKCPRSDNDVNLVAGTTAGNNRKERDSNCTESNEYHPLCTLSSDSKKLICDFLGEFDQICQLRLVSKLSFPHPDYSHTCELALRKGFMTGKARLNMAQRGLLCASKRKRLRWNGYYSLKEMVTKAPNNDRFWEERKVMSIETIHYRILRFLDNGVCLYSLNTLSPWENPLGIEPSTNAASSGLTVAGKINLKLRDSVYFGHWFWCGKSLEVAVDVVYAKISFSFDILHGRESYGNYHGNHSVLSMTKHAQIVDEGGGQEMHFKLPVNSDFIFNRRSEMMSSDKFLRSDS